MSSDFGASVRSMQPSSMTYSISSMRTPNLPGQIDARLGGDDAAGGERRLSAARRSRRRLMDLQTDAVAEAVAEGVAVTGLPR